MQSAGDLQQSRLSLMVCARPDCRSSHALAVPPEYACSDRATDDFNFSGAGARQRRSYFIGQRKLPTRLPGRIVRLGRLPALRRPPIVHINHWAAMGQGRVVCCDLRVDTSDVIVCKPFLEFVDDA